MTIPNANPDRVRDDRGQPLMVPLDAAAARYVRTWLGPPAGPGLLALRHALVYRRPGLWGDHPTAPRSVLLAREGDNRLEVFGAGLVGTVAAWLPAQGRPFALCAPEEWFDSLRARLPDLEIFPDAVETWAGPSPAPPSRASDEDDDDELTLADSPTVEGPKVITRQLTASDFAAFTAAAPGWALRGWRSFPALIEYGAAFGVPHGSSFASVAWTFDQVDGYDAIAVATMPRYRRLGLARAAVTELIGHVIQRRGKVPIWSTTSDNAASRGLALSLGFSVVATEPLARWSPSGGTATSHGGP